MKERILIVDDDTEIRETLKSALSEDFIVHGAEDGISALEQVEVFCPRLVLLDMDMPRLNGLETLKRIKAVHPRIIVMILTAYSTIPDAVEAVQAGAFNYLAKPIQIPKLIEAINKAIEAHEMVAEMAYSAPVLGGEQKGKRKFSSRSDEMQKVYGLVERVAHVDTVVLLRGESGTGKEVVAQAIHANSLRKNGKFVAVNCGALPENLIESELFGHEKGAFTGADQRKIGTFQYAEGGTLFLDEVAEISPTMQVKLLRVLQEKKFTPVGSNLEIQANVRIIAATNQNLEAMLKSGALREDFYYRLNVLPIFLPPLRDRKEDIELLTRHFIRKFNQEHGRQVQGIDEPTMVRLKSHDWPGNIRELRNVIEHAFVLESDTTLRLPSLPDYLKDGVSLDSSLVVPFGDANLSDLSEEGSVTDQGGSEFMEVTTDELDDFQAFKEKMEREFIVQALTRFKGMINQTSLKTNIPKKTLLRKIEKYKINTAEFKDH